MMQFNDDIEAEEHLISCGFTKKQDKKENKKKRLLFKDNMGNIMEIRKGQVFFDIKL